MFDPVATNGNCDKLERSGKQEVHFKTKKAPESTSKHLDFSDFVFQLLYLIRGGSKMNQNEPKDTKANTTDLSDSQLLQDDLMSFHDIPSKSPLPPERIGFSGSPTLVDAVQQQQ